MVPDHPWVPHHADTEPYLIGTEGRGCVFATVFCWRTDIVTGSARDFFGNHVAHRMSSHHDEKGTVSGRVVVESTVTHACPQLPPKQCAVIFVDGVTNDWFLHAPGHSAGHEETIVHHDCWRQHDWNREGHFPLPSLVFVDENIVEDCATVVFATYEPDLVLVNNWRSAGYPERQRRLFDPCFLKRVVRLDISDRILAVRTSYRPKIAFKT